jgi:predicted MFS family arabinose efflux permease
MEVVEEEYRPAYMALHNMGLNLGILLGSLLAPILAETFSLPNALIISAFLRAFAGIILFLWG